MNKYKKDFPLLSTKKGGKNLVYLDNASTTQKPLEVIESVRNFYLKENANIHRGVYSLSEQATLKYEAARNAVAKFINASSYKEIIFTGGTTDSINMLALSLSFGWLKKGDEVVITVMEHHSNFVPWQMLRDRIGIVLKIVDLTPKGDLDWKKGLSLINDKTKVVSFTLVSNAIGVINPAEKIVKEIRRKSNALIIVDAAQAVAHRGVDVQSLDVDFLAFSAHKMYGPTGVGVLYGKKHLLDKLAPVRGGGDMILNVTIEHSDYQETPFKFEAGTPNIAGIIGLHAAIKYINRIGFEYIENKEKELLLFAEKELSKIAGLNILGKSKNKSSIISFTLEGVHPHDLATLLDRDNIAIRAGHHCAQPLLNVFKLKATNRVSLSFYNDFSDIRNLVKSLIKIKNKF